jgi:DNA mismatch repair protein MutL
VSRIRVLPEILAHKIAAGEIVERPASVVKELVENSLDAGARDIRIAFSSGGKRLITVADDGEGMTGDDALLAFEHHATSKIQTAADLGAIATLGFRGEALPSIASVSRLLLRTRARDDAALAGTEIEIQGGTIRSVKPVPWNPGTELTVRDLFFNLPARRKFLRSNDTEAAHITRLVTHYALAYPGVRFRLESEARLVFDATVVAGLRERVYQVFGDRFLENLVEVAGQRGEVAVSGFTSLAREQRTNTYSQFFFVNHRMVRDKVLTGAVRQAYRHVLPATAHPALLLFIDLPYDAVDVNAHPAKLEIRFRDSSAVFEAVREGIARAIGATTAIPEYDHRPVFVTPVARAGVAESQQGFDYSAAAEPGLSCRETLPSPDPEPAGEAAARPFLAGGVRILGQIQESYIVCSDREGVVLIDQHAAHERVLYERNAEAMQRRGVEVQGLVVPIAVELEPRQLLLLDRVAGELERQGFEIERFGRNAVLVRAVPALVRDQDCMKLLVELLDGLDREERTLDLEKISDRIAVNLACRAAIKVHTPLTEEKMRWLVDALGRARIPTHCPHGRPSLLRLSLHEIERNFGRI